MLPLDRARRFYAAYGWRSGILVAGVALVVAVHLAERDRSKGPELVHHDRDPDAFREIVNRPDVYTLDVHAPEQQHIDGTDAFVPYDSIHDHRRLLPVEDTPIALYCRNDSMSRQVTDVLSKLGYGENLPPPGRYPGLERARPPAHGVSLRRARRPWHRTDRVTGHRSSDSAASSRTVVALYAKATPPTNSTNQ